MKRIFSISLGFAMFCLGLLSVSQRAYASDPETVPQHLGLETVVGCLSRTNGQYVITGGGGGGKQFRIVEGEDSQLKGWIQGTVEVVGVVAKNDALENQNGLVNEGTTTGVGYLTIKADKIRRVSGNCSYAGKEWEGDHTKK